jgi:hypothetical protein
MTLKQATLIALIGTWIAFALHSVQFTWYAESYLRLGMAQLLLSFASLVLNHAPLLVFLTVLHKKQSE